MRNNFIKILMLVCCFQACKKGSDPTPAPAPVKTVSVSNVSINAAPFFDLAYGINQSPAIIVKFTEPLQKTSATAAISFTNAAGVVVPATTSFQNGDSTLKVVPASPLNYLTKYNFKITSALRSASNGGLTTPVDKIFITQIDSTPKFPIISDNALLDLVQQQTLKYFYDFGHPTSGLARERSNGDNNVVTTGGSGFGIMALITGVNRNFITKAQGLTRLTTIVDFLKNKAQTFHGAFPHWLNGATGVVVPFSAQDNGADLVETSFLMQGLLCARQYFNTNDPVEIALRSNINSLYNAVEWDWFRKNNEDVLYWHWSPSVAWAINLPIRGWNECLVTYVLGASSTTHSVPKSVYTNGFAGNADFKNGNVYYGYQLPLGPQVGGPLFFEHYSFMGINPKGLTDVYADYNVQTTNHTLINYKYCITNPNQYFGYSDQCWGLTASDIPNGYTASSPTNDVGVIAPTAALSSFAYTPGESMKALKFFYYQLGDHLWKDYGFVDAFSLKDIWFAPSHLAIDQGPIIVMIENYRSGLLWNLFTSCPEVKTGMKNLGFTAPYL